MNYDVSKKTIAVSNLAFDGCQELPIDLDFNLPDYCPDIQRILKCGVKPNITISNISGDRLNIEGIAAIRILYIDSEKKALRCCENSTPFSTSIDLKTSPENAVAEVKIKIGYVNCRPVSPRKIDLHGAFSLCAKIHDKNNIEVISEVSGDDIEQKNKEITVSSLLGLGGQQFTINESLDLGNNKPAPEIILRSDANINITACKAYSNKVEVRGEAFVKILYISDIDSSQTETAEYSIPFIQTVDVPGVTEDSKCVATAKLLSFNEQITSDTNDENLVTNLITAEIKGALTVKAFEDKEIEIVTDAYSTMFDVENTSEIIKTHMLSEIINEEFLHKQAIELPDTRASKIIDVWGDITSLKGIYKDNQIKFSGKIDFSILGLDDENMPFYSERTVEFEHFKEFEPYSDETEINCTAQISGVNFKLSGNNKIDLKVDIKLNASVFACTKNNMITNVSTDETHPSAKDENSALTIYYADPGESIWNIARKYYTKVSAIMDENELSSDVIEQHKMILIPMK